MTNMNKKEIEGVMMEEEYKEVLQDLSISVAEKISKEWMFLTHEEKRLVGIIHDALNEASIAACPDLLKALWDVEAYLDRGEYDADPEAALEAARAAIAKAQGRVVE